MRRKSQIQLAEERGFRCHVPFQSAALPKYFDPYFIHDGLTAQETDEIPATIKWMSGPDPELTAEQPEKLATRDGALAALPA
ncbi:MAG: hypothetical protein AAF988_00875 [Pseudomonadota bacterium]